MKKVISTLLIAIGVLACTEAPISSKKVSATQYDFSWTKDKCIQDVRYIDNGNDLIISFKDGSELILHSYKYDIKVK